MQVIRALLRASRKAYHEYQRQLHDPGIDDLYEGEERISSIAQQSYKDSEQISQMKAEIGEISQSMMAFRKQGDFVNATECDKAIEALQSKSRMVRVVCCVSFTFSSASVFGLRMMI